MSHRLTRIVLGHLKKARRENHPHIIYHVIEDNIRYCYIMVVNMPGQYAGGEYIFRLHLPDDFPTNPPSLVAYTPNGIYDLGGKICISIGEFHKQKWRPAIGLAGFAREVVNGMLCPSGLDNGGIRIVAPQFSNVDRATFARSSQEYNKSHKPLLRTLLFSETESLASQRWRQGTEADELAHTLKQTPWSRIWENLGLLDMDPPLLQASLAVALRERDPDGRRLLGRLAQHCCYGTVDVALKEDVIAAAGGEPARAWVSAALAAREVSKLQSLILTALRGNFTARDAILAFSD